MEDSPQAELEHRTKRQKIDKKGRFAALQKLKDLKGKKHKAEISEEIDNVYDVVDEKEYSKLAVNQYGTDWIEDDGTGYLEDGRDFFEDEDEGYENDKSSKRKTKKRSREEEKPVKGKGSIRNLFSNAVPKKKKETVVKLNEDDVLADILGELDSDTNKNADLTNENSATVIKMKNDDAVIKEYMQNFMTTIKRTEKPKNDAASDDEMLDRILKPTILKVKCQEKKVVGTDYDARNRKSDEINIAVRKDDIQDTEKLRKKLEGDNSKLNEKTKENAHIPEKNIPPQLANEIDMDLSAFNDEENEFDNNDTFKSCHDPKFVESVPVNIKNEEQYQGKIGLRDEEEEMNNLLKNWENYSKINDFDEEINAAIKDDEQKINLENLKFWYWDAWEDAQKRPGDVFLFGKINNGDTKGNFKSLCVHIENIERVLYLLPRQYLLDPITKETTKQKVTLMDVYKEFENNIAVGLGIKMFKSEKVTKNFAFHMPGVDVPESCEYIEIRYEGKKQAPDSKQKYNSIAHIFGTNTSFLETFLLERKIKGPCWLSINDFRINERPLSWCKVEAVCSNPSTVNLADDQKTSPPPMIVMSITVRSILNQKTNKNEVVMISCLVNNRYLVDKPPPTPPFNRHFCGFTRPSIQNWPLDLQHQLSQYKSTKTTKLDSERALLSWFLATYQGIDPDLVATHDMYDLQLDLICDRIGVIKIPMWSRLGRLRMTQITGKKPKDFFIGRMICDVKKSAEELIKSKSYDLETLCQNVLKIKEGERREISNDDLLTMYEKSDNLLKLITLTMQDCSFILRLMLEMNVIPLALQITNVCGNLMSRTLQGGRSERNEFLLLHAFYEKNYIVPDKKKKVWATEATHIEADDTQQATSSRKKAAYSGGLVLDPIKGFYDKYILLMDFNSLYPSIIQEFNICFTTIPEPENANDLPPLPDSSVEQGILPRQIRRLVESRREVKKLMATPDLDADLKMQYNIRQLALKLTANSMYGCLGFANSRFFAQFLASLVTAKGREILMNTKSIVQKSNFEVIYGDTDSIMINTNSLDYDQVFKIGHNIKQMVNKTYRQIELEIDGVFKYLLLLKKKKYAAVTVTKNNRGELITCQEHKGLDIVRRDWSQVSVMAGKLVLNEILSDTALEDKLENIHAHLEKFKQNILDGSVPVQLLTITKQLTKPPNEYSNINGLPHVSVAKRMNETRNKRYKKGDMVAYIICEDGTENPAMQRAYHAEELKLNEKLKIDTYYYLAQQLHPVVSRLCDPLEGTDPSRIAEYLGLDPKKFKTSVTRYEQNDFVSGESIIKSNLQKFRQCEKFIFTCISCKKENIVATAFRPHDKTYIAVLQKCSNSECASGPYQYIASIRNQMILSIQSFIKRFYNNWMICDEPTCNVNTRIYSHVLVNKRPVCLTCKIGSLIRAYSEHDLHQQISYYQYMFDLTKHEQKNITVPQEVEAAYKTLKDTVDQLLQKSAYCTINLNKVFEGMKPLNTLDLIPDKTFVIL